MSAEADRHTRASSANISVEATRRASDWMTNVTVVANFLADQMREIHGFPMFLSINHEFGMIQILPDLSVENQRIARSALRAV